MWFPTICPNVGGWYKCVLIRLIVVTLTNSQLLRCVCVLRVLVFPGIKFIDIEQKRDSKKSSCIKTKMQWVLFSFTVDT